MPTVAINAPKTPVTKGSNGIAMATLPNVCKMPGPPPPFVPTPLPNIGQSSKMPMGYSTTVKIEGQPVAIQGASFGSSGDIASKASGGGILSANAEGPTKFLGPGSLDVKIEGKSVQLLGDPTLNNCGPAGSPANSATMAGVLQPPLALAKQAADAGVAGEVAHVCEVKCECQAKGQGQRCISKRLDEEDRAQRRLSTIKSEVPYNMKPSPPEPFMKSYEKDGTPLSGPLRPSSNWFRPHRRPDVVVVADRTQPPYGDNIKAVVEVKLKGDRWRERQFEAYRTIARGDENRVIEVNEANCPCPDDKRREPVPVPMPAPVEKRVERKQSDESPLPWKPISVAVAAVAAVALAVAVVGSAPVVATAAAAAVAFGLFTASSNPSAAGSPDVI